MDISQQTDYYNRRWSKFEYANTLELERATVILEGILASGIDYPRICDLGCGAGWLPALLGLFGPVLGVDLSDTAVRTAAERFPHARFEAADILNWNYPKEGFDIVVSQEVIEHVEDQEKYLSIAHGLLRPGGWLVLTTPNAATMLAMPEDQRRAWTNQPIENWLQRGQLHDLMARKFEHVEVSTIILGNGSTGLYRLVNSVKLQRAAGIFGLGRFWQRSACRLGFGLHLVGKGRKR